MRDLGTVGTSLNREIGDYGMIWEFLYRTRVWEFWEFWDFGKEDLEYGISEYKGVRL